MLKNIPSTNCPSNHIHPRRFTASLLIFGDLGASYLSLLCLGFLICNKEIVNKYPYSVTVKKHQLTYGKHWHMESYTKGLTILVMIFIIITSLLSLETS